MSAFELRYEAQSRNDSYERAPGASPFRLDDLFSGESSFSDRDVSGAISKLTRQGILPNVELKYPEGDGGNNQDSLFSKVDSNRDQQLNAKELVEFFDKIAGGDQQASIEDMRKELAQDDAAKLFDGLDENKDQQLSMTEWLQYVQKLLGNDGNVTREEFQRSRFEGVGESPPGGYSPRSPYAPGGSPQGPETPHAPAQAPHLPGAPADAPQAPSDAPQLPTDAPQGPGDAPGAPGEVPTASPEQVQQLFSRIENHGASEDYMQEVRQSLSQLPATVVQAAIDGGTKFVVNGQGPPGLGGTYSSATNTLTMYESSPFDTTTTLAAEMFHNWDLNPTVGRHISSQPWFQDAYQRALQSGLDTGDNTFSNPFEFIHHMAKFYSGSTDPKVAQLMDFLGPQYREMTRQALLS